MRKIIAMLASCLLAGAAHAGHIQANLLDASVMACLQKRAELIDYPDRDEELKVSGQVRVSLRFVAPDKPPNVEVLFRASSDAMINEIRSYLKSYRLPCMKPDAGPVLAVQEFQFTPRATDPITWTSPRRVAEEGLKPSSDPTSPLACLRTPTDRPWIDGSGLERDTRRERSVSNIVVEAVFEAPDEAPKLKVLYSTVNKQQERNVLGYIEQYRLPCLKSGAQPVGLQQQFHFLTSGATQMRIKDSMPLTAFLSNIKGIGTTRVQFDFSSMDCPFQVAWTLGRPAMDNRVGEVGAPNLNRTELLAWLATLQMDIDAVQFEHMLGQTVIVNIPCGSLNIKPAG